MTIELAAWEVLDEARRELDERKERYNLFEAYYEGDHRLAFASDRWLNAFGPIFQELRDNLCELVVDALKARLRVDGFGVEITARDQGSTPPEEVGNLPLPPEPGEPGVPPEPEPEPPKPGEMERQRADDIWIYNRMDATQSEIHEEAPKKGDAYVIVWKDVSGRACIHPNDADIIYCKYDLEQPDYKQWAVKLYQDGNHLRANIYYPDRIEKYITTPAAKLDPKSPDGWEQFTDTAINVEYDEVLDAEREVEVPEEWPTPNPYGEVPVFHFRNRGKKGQYGRSELWSVIPLQDALNKSIMDLMVAAEFLGYPQRYATGLTPPRDETSGKPDTNLSHLRPGVDQLWALWGEAVKLGEFSAADLMPHIAQCNDLRAEIGRVSQTPPHMLFMFTGEIPSGEALKVVESPFTAKVEDRQTQWGNTWEDVMRFAVLVDTDQEMKVQLKCDWADTQPKSQKEEAETLLLWQQLGVPKDIIWRRLGFSDREIEDMKKMGTPPPSLTDIMDAAAQENGQLQPKGVTPPALAPFAAATQRAGAGGPPNA